MYLLDTDVIVDYLRGKKQTVELLTELDDIYAKRLFTSAINVAELFYGLFNSNNPKKYWPALADMLGKIDILSIDEIVAKKFGQLKSELKSKGELLDNSDILIASVCLIHDLILVTRNEKHFSKIPNLKIKIII